MKVISVLARQFAQPSGFMGRYLITPWLDRTNRTPNDAVFRKLPFQPHSHVGEIGFGGGDLLFRIVEALGTVSVTGIDSSSAAVARVEARALRSTARARIQLRTGTVEQLPLSDRELDLAVSVNTVYFWHSIPKCLLELNRVIKPGGYLVLGFSDGRNLKQRGYTRHGYGTPSVQQIFSAMTTARFGEIDITTVSRGTKGNFNVIKGRKL